MAKRRFKFSMGFGEVEEACSAHTSSRFWAGISRKIKVCPKTDTFTINIAVITLKRCIQLYICSCAKISRTLWTYDLYILENALTIASFVQLRSHEKSPSRTRLRRQNGWSAPRTHTHLPQSEREKLYIPHTSSHSHPTHKWVDMQNCKLRSKAFPVLKILLLRFQKPSQKRRHWWAIECIIFQTHRCTVDNSFRSLRWHL